LRHSRIQVNPFPREILAFEDLLDEGFREVRKVSGVKGVEVLEEGGNLAICANSAGYFQIFQAFLDQIVNFTDFRVWIGLFSLGNEEF
jgi:hypothetical protein